MGVRYQTADGMNLTGIALTQTTNSQHGSAHHITNSTTAKNMAKIVLDADYANRGLTKPSNTVIEATVNVTGQYSYSYQAYMFYDSAYPSNTYTVEGFALDKPYVIKNMTGTSIFGFKAGERYTTIDGIVKYGSIEKRSPDIWPAKTGYFDYNSSAKPVVWDQKFKLDLVNGVYESVPDPDDICTPAMKSRTLSTSIKTEFEKVSGPHYDSLINDETHNSTNEQVVVTDTSGNVKSSSGGYYLVNPGETVHIRKYTTMPTTSAERNSSCSALTNSTSCDREVWFDLNEQVDIEYIIGANDGVETGYMSRTLSIGTDSSIQKIFR